MEHIPGRQSQAKGRRGELELARILQEYGYNVQPGRAQNYGKEPDIRGLPGVHIEAKRCEQVRICEWIDQAEQDSKRFHDGVPAVFFRRSRAPWMVVMKLEDWIKLYQKEL